LKHWERTILK